jgi:hypothetical protein
VLITNVASAWCAVRVVRRLTMPHPAAPCRLTMPPALQRLHARQLRRAAEAARHLRRQGTGRPCLPVQPVWCAGVRLAGPNLRVCEGEGRHVPADGEGPHVRSPELHLLQADALHQVNVNGPATHPVWKYLKQEKPGDVNWK